MNRKEEMLALAKEIKDEADNISPTQRTHPAGVMLQWASRLRKLAALRASAAPEEGMEENLADAREFCKAAFGPFNVDTEPYAKIIAELMDRASQRSKYNTYNALPSDSGKAAPDAWRDALEKIAGIREYAPEDHAAAALYKREEGWWTTDEYLADAALAALAPATEGGPVTHPSADRKGEANV